MATTLLQCNHNIYRHLNVYRYDSLLAIYLVYYNFNNKIIIKLSMTQLKSFQTPLKEEQQNVNIPMTTDLTPQRSFPASDYKVDYKLKTFKLMKQLAESEMLNKKSQTQIRHLQKEIDAFKKEIEKIFKMLGVLNLDEAYKKIEFILQSDKKMASEDKINEWTNIIEEYKKIINTQQYKYIKLEQQYKISEVKLKRYEQDKFQTIKQKGQENLKQSSQVNQAYQSSQLSQEIKQLKIENSNLQKNQKSLEEEVAILKKEYKQAIVERDHIKDLFEQLQNKYNLEIQHFEEMEKHVEERLIQVEKQMNYYRQQREEHLQKIELMKKEIDYRQNQSYYSFGGTKNIETQTEQAEQIPQFNNECLQISIKTLLQENERLKNTLITLYSNRSSENLPKEIQLQLKILVNMKENIRKSQQREKTKATILEIQQENQKQNKQQLIEQKLIQLIKAPEIIQQQQQEQSQGNKQSP